MAGDELLGLRQKGLALGFVIGAVGFGQQRPDPVDDAVTVDRPILPDRVPVTE